MHFIGRSPSDKGLVTRLQAELDHELLVTDEDRAILFESGAPLVDLGPGRHTLSPSRIPALRVAGDLTGVQIYLIRSRPSPVPVRGTTQPVPITANVLARVEFEGSCQVQITDARLLLSSLAVADPGTEIVAAAERAVRQAVTRELAAAGGSIPDLRAAPQPAFLEAVRASAAEALAPHGATATAVTLALRLDDAQQELARTRPPTGAVPAATGAAPHGAPPAQLAEVPTAPAGSCPRCGTPSTGARFCSGCGAPAANGGCTVCGAALAPGARFCSTCGKPVTLAPRRCGCGAELAANAKFCSCGAKA